MAQDTTVTLERRIAFAFTRHCRSQGFPARKILESLMVQFLQDRGVKIPEDSELPPVSRRSWKVPLVG